MFFATIARYLNAFRRARAERLAREAMTVVSADELRRAGIMTTLGGSYTLPFALLISGAPALTPSCGCR